MTPAKENPPMTDRVYVLGGERVTVRALFVLPSKARPLPLAPSWLRWHRPPARAPKNAAVVWPSGQVRVRPFRGLRRIKENTDA